MKKTIIGLFTALLLVGMAGCKNGVESGGGNIGTFGSFPQSEKASNVLITSETKTVGSFTYYKGSDGEWYAELKSKYYKVEPIKWRVLTTNYDHDGNASTPGKKLLLAESILINKAYDDDSSSYADSKIRKYLTGDFLTTAFTQEEQAAIETTTVINNARSTNPDSNDKQFNNGVNQYASDTPTSDKIFLLSEQEVTKADYGFAVYDASGTGNTRIRMSTAFAKANGAYQNGTTAGYGGYWWLRSPFYYGSEHARNVYDNGAALDNYHVCSEYIGVVPALCLK